METILDRVKRMCEMREMSIAELERKAELGNGSIRRWEDSIPSADKLQRVAKILGVDMTYLLTGESENPELKTDAIILARKANELTDEQLSVVNSIIEQFQKTNSAN